MRTRTILGLLALAAGALATPAHAESGLVSADISRFQYQLIDLDPNDGLWPSIDFSVTEHQANYLSGSPHRSDRVDGYGSTGYDGAYGGAKASVDATSLSSHAYFTSGEHGSHVYHASTSSWLEFTLSPSTGLLVSAIGTLHAGHDGADAARASLHFALTLFPASDLVSGGTTQAHYFGTQNGDRTDRLSAYLASGDLTQRGVLNMGTQTVMEYFAPVTPPVPEPATYGMLLAGAALIGAAARRRKPC